MFKTVFTNGSIAFGTHKLTKNLHHPFAPFPSQRRRVNNGVSSITRELGWASLQSRRTVHDLTLFYKIHSGAVIIQFPPELVSTVRRTRASQQHNRTFIHPCTSVDSYKYSFFVRTVPYWNSLPPSVINANSTTSFFPQVSNIYCH